MTTPDRLTVRITAASARPQREIEIDRRDPLRIAERTDVLQGQQRSCARVIAHTLDREGVRWQKRSSLLLAPKSGNDRQSENQLDERTGFGDGCASLEGRSAASNLAEMRSPRIVIALSVSRPQAFPPYDIVGRIHFTICVEIARQRYLKIDRTARIKQFVAEGVRMQRPRLNPRWNRSATRN